MKCKASHHNKCCREFVNIKKRNRASQGYTDTLEQRKSTGCSSTNTLETENEVKQLRSQNVNYR